MSTSWPKQKLRLLQKKMNVSSLLSEMVLLATLWCQEEERQHFQGWVNRQKASFTVYSKSLGKPGGETVVDSTLHRAGSCIGEGHISSSEGLMPFINCRTPFLAHFPYALGTHSPSQSPKIPYSDSSQRAFRLLWEESLGVQISKASEHHKTPCLYFPFRHSLTSAALCAAKKTEFYQHNTGIAVLPPKLQQDRRKETSIRHVHVYWVEHIYNEFGLESSSMKWGKHNTSSSTMFWQNLSGQGKAQCGANRHIWLSKHYTDAPRTLLFFCRSDCRSPSCPGRKRQWNTFCL